MLMPVIEIEATWNNHWGKICVHVRSNEEKGILDTGHRKRYGSTLVREQQSSMTRNCTQKKMNDLNIDLNRAGAEQLV